MYRTFSRIQKEKYYVNWILCPYVTEKPCWPTKCPKIYNKSVLHLHKLPQICAASAEAYFCGIPKQMQYRFVVNFGTLSNFRNRCGCVWSSDLGNSICIRHLFKSRAVTNLLFFRKDLRTFSTCSELPSNISTMQHMLIWINNKAI